MKKCAEVIRFLIVGFSKTIIGYIIFASFVYFGFSYTLAVTFDYFFGVSFGYFINKYWTFKSTRKSSKEILNYFALYFMIYILNIIILKYFVQTLNIDPYIAQLVVVLILTLLSYGVQKFHIFKKGYKYVK